MMRHTAAVGQCVFSSNSLFGLMCWSSGRMQVCFLLLLLIQLHVTEGCSLKGNKETEEIIAYTGDSVLLPCSCTELHSKPETFTWKKYTNNWAQISPESDEYKERFQLVNDHSSGNLSLLISHLTEQDGGEYRCDVNWDEYRYVRLTVKGCSLKRNKETEQITAYTGDSVLLPCSCTELHSKPEIFTWEKNTDGYNWAQISPESDEYKKRFQLVNDHSSGNLSLLISHLTVQDGGYYRCNVKGDEYRYIRLTVKDCRLKGNGETEEITAYTGDSVLLPCSCTELHSKPETFTWKKYTDGNNWAQISPESDEYKERFQLVNDHSSGNLSLLISHLTEQDGGDYRCDVKGGEYRDVRLTVAGCRLKEKRWIEITAYTGDSVLLPCSCTELHRKPETFAWKKSTDKWAQISPECDEYKDRFQLVNDHSSGNLSLLISHLTEQDGGYYRCDVKGGEYRDLRLTVKGCSLKGNKETEQITAYTGDSVLLPCSCTELHRKPETFTWEKRTAENRIVNISTESDEYKERFQLVNDHSSGNLSLLISHLTEQDGGVYRCDVKGDEYRDIRLTVKGCRLNQQTVDVTGIVGQSVLLPCSCSELQAKPHTFRWSFVKGSDVIKIFPKEQTNLYTDRVQVFNVHPPGNLSLLISQLTVEDGGFYRCEIGEMTTYIYLTVKDSLIYFPVAMVTVLFLHIIVAVVYCTTIKKGSGTVHYSKGDGEETVSLQ
ncbi:obscurin-like [Tachysurus fulvidraco]|uniref:obscurin-like n=1 Tax=Tachysurus fulvidraco TaxID=1234273 RepID=UPI001FF01770|nr:obscurin-like [Tachysurus fulvidraco]